MKVPRFIFYSYVLLVGFFWACSDEDNYIKDQTPTQALNFTVEGVSFKMILVEAGTFQMGSLYSNDNQRPVHNVTISHDYYLAETEVTQSLWKAVMGYNPSKYVGNNNPVENVNWEACHEFCIKLSQLTGVNFRMPTEAEWEYAARGGNQSKGYIYSGSNNVNEVAWYEVERTHPVKAKSPNELGLYDMSGNVWEWCSDWFGSYGENAITDPTGPLSGNEHVLRGGWAGQIKSYCTTTFRWGYAPSVKGEGLGFRLALTVLK